MPEAQGADNHPMVFRNKGQPARGRAPLAQPLAGLGKTGRAKGIIEQSLTRRHIRYMLMAQHKGRRFGNSVQNARVARKINHGHQSLHRAKTTLAPVLPRI